ncbi:CDP-4-dehydro-6-deoxy-D-gulose 4-reductase [Spirochaetia bacterium]|nr:CDP-4-dehydro-6-deoxy-D-gulose 4-reductase [Spirochaetia bacterium]
MKRVIVTGATGLIGKEAIEPLIRNGFEVTALSRNGNKYTNFIEVDIFDNNNLEKIFKQIRPEYLLHFAWYTQEGSLTSDLNYQWKNASLNMLKIFKKYGGKRAVFAGTCFEYEFGNIPLREGMLINPISIYGQCKNELREEAEAFSKENDISFGWGRIFYVLGHGENPKRLLPYIANSLKSNQTAAITSGPLIRDYMYSKDIAGAFVKFLDGDVTGCVNICTGRGISIKEFADKVGGILGKMDLLEFRDNVQDQPAVIVGDNSRMIHTVGYNPQYCIDTALKNIL